MRSYQWACFALVILTGTVVAQGEKPKKPLPIPNDVEVRLHDGSRVRMIVQQETLEIETKYGKLLVPTLECRRVEFGIRPPEAIGKKIADAIKRLGHETFKERENAANELVAIGAPAYLALYKASKAGDLEVANRAKAALDRIRQKVPEEKLRVREDDMVQTAEFTIVGRISASSIKASTPIFGETALKVTDLRGIRWLGGQAELEVSVDGAKYAVGGNQWLDTGVEVSAEDDLVLAASGQIDMMTDGSGQYVTGPTGTNRWGGGGGAGGAMPGALIGRIGDNGPIFTIGDGYKGLAKREGKLFLSIVQTPWGRGGGGGGVTGAFKVNITGGRDTLER